MYIVLYIFICMKYCHRKSMSCIYKVSHVCMKTTFF